MFGLIEEDGQFEITITEECLVFCDPTFSERGIYLPVEPGKWQIIPVYSEEAHRKLECCTLIASGQTPYHKGTVNFSTDTSLIGLVNPDADPDDVEEEVHEGLSNTLHDVFAGDNYLALCMGRECDATVTFSFNQAERIVGIFIFPQDD